MDIIASLQPHQRDAVKWLEERDRGGHAGGILCHEMGLGKTLTLLTLISRISKKTLVIMPKSVISQWVDEITKWTDGSDYSVNDMSGRLVLMSSSSLLTARGEEAARVVWDRLIIDEAHEFRNPRSKKYEALQNIIRRHTICATATPIVNRMRDFISLQGILGVSQGEIQKNFLHHKSNSILVATKKTEKLESTKLIQKTIHCELTDAEFAHYKDVYMTQVVEANTTAIGEIGLLSCILYCRRAMITASKYREIFSNWSTHLFQKHVIFCDFISDINGLKTMFSERGIQTFIFQGKLDDRERCVQLREFQNAGPGAVMLSQTKCGSVGLNLQTASVVHILSPTWSPAVTAQAIGRCWRNGQTQDVHAFHYISLSHDETIVPSIDLTILKLQEEKFKIYQETATISVADFPHEKSLRSMKSFFHTV